MQGRELNIYQKADAMIEFNKLLDYVEELEQCNIANVGNNEVALKDFVEEFVEAWEDGMGGDTDLYKKAKSLL